ncbi:ankyrin repeat domain-containing protein, partial [Candidatus Dependentiae bacterium]|nr:ankyrin repeat domain-containing protein [Candidatus Dependentiae bacterium]
MKLFIYILMLSVCVLPGLYSMSDTPLNRAARINREKRILVLKNAFTQDPNHRLTVNDYKSALNDLIAALFEQEDKETRRLTCDLLIKVVKVSDKTLPGVCAININCLGKAIHHKKLDVVRLFLSLGVDCNKADSIYGLPLENAVKDGNVTLIGCLIIYGATIPEHLANDLYINEAQQIQVLVDKAIFKEDSTSLDSSLEDDNTRKDTMFARLYTQRVERNKRLTALKDAFKQNTNYKLTIEYYKQAINDLGETVSESLYDDKDLSHLITQVLQAVDGTLPEIGVVNQEFLTLVICQQKLPLVKLLLELGIKCTHTHLVKALSYSTIEILSCVLNSGVLSCVLTSGVTVPSYLARHARIIEAQKLYSTVKEPQKCSETIQ